MLKLIVISIILGNSIENEYSPQGSAPGRLLETLTARNKELKSRTAEVCKVVRGLNWTSLSFYTESQFMTEEWSMLLKALTDAGIFRMTAFSRLDTVISHYPVIRNILEKSDERLHIIVCPLECAERIIRLITNEVSKEKLFLSKWLFITNSSLSLSTVEKLENVACLYRESKKTDKFRCSSKMTTLDRSNGNRLMRQVEDIDVCGGEDYSCRTYRERLFPGVHRGIFGQTFRIGAAEWYPYIEKEVLDNGTERFVGLGIDVFEEMAKYLNVSIQYVELKGEVDPWPKLTEMVKNKELDSTASSYFITPDRTQWFDFTYPTDFNRVHIYYRLPQEMDLRWRLLIDILSWPALILTVLSLLCTAFVPQIFYSVRNVQGLTCSAEGCRERVCDMIWFLFGNLFKQGQVMSHEAQKDFSVRLVLSAWCVFCLVLSITFTAYLVPALGFVKQPILFHSIGDLLNHGEYKWGVWSDESYYFSLLKRSSAPEFQELYRGIIDFNKSDSEVLSANVEVHKRKILTEKYAFISSSMSMESFVAEHCDVARVDKLAELPFAFLLPKGSAFTPFISKWIRNFHENGQIERWKRKWIPKRNCTVAKTKSEVLTMVDVQSMFVVVASGTVLSLIVLMFEQISFRYLGQRDLKKTKKYVTCQRTL